MAWRRSSLRSGRKGYFGPVFLRSTLDAVDALDRLGRERRGAAEEEERELHDRDGGVRRSRLHKSARIETEIIEERERDFALRDVAARKFQLIDRWRAQE